MFDFHKNSELNKIFNFFYKNLGKAHIEWKSESLYIRINSSFITITLSDIWPFIYEIGIGKYGSFDSREPSLMCDRKIKEFTVFQIPFVFIKTPFAKLYNLALNIMKYRRKEAVNQHLKDVIVDLNKEVK